MGFISCHITSLVTSLVIHSLEGEHTHIQTSAKNQFLRNHAAGAPGLKVAKVGKSIIYIDAVISNVLPAFLLLRLMY